ncbi:MAG: accessory gene regulator B family protein [Lachnospiraceae bacterium]|nr:accessory gene regulator B family protein [Lachnospiraceae bacterium]
MYDNISRNITDRLLEKNIIDKDDWEIYYYGIYQLVMNTFEIITLLIIGYIMDEIFKCIVFVMAFSIMRIYAGGYHASTPLRCYCMTTFTTITSLLVMKYVTINYFICYMVMLVSSIIILRVSPVETQNKPLDMLEKKIYRKKTLIALSIETIATILFSILRVSSVVICITTAEVVLCVALIYEIVRRKCTKTKNKICFKEMR